MDCRIVPSVRAKPVHLACRWRRGEADDERASRPLVGIYSTSAVDSTGPLFASTRVTFTEGPSMPPAPQTAERPRSHAWINGACVASYRGLTNKLCVITQIGSTS